MKKFAIMDGDMFLQCMEPNDNYVPAGRAIQTNLHSFNEYNPIFGHEEKWFDARTISGMLPFLIEAERWNGMRYKAYALICKEE